MPTSAMHVVDDYLSKDIRWQFFIYWFPSAVNLLVMIFLLSKITIFRARVGIIFSILVFIYHIVHIALHYGAPSTR